MNDQKEYVESLENMLCAAVNKLNAEVCTFYWYPTFEPIEDPGQAIEWMDQFLKRIGMK
jgi:hypothetical protein